MAHARLGVQIIMWATLVMQVSPQVKGQLIQDPHPRSQDDTTSIQLVVSYSTAIPAYDMTNLDIHIEVSHSSARVTVSAKPKPSKLRGGYEVVQLQTFILYYKMFDGRNSSSWENM